MKARVFFVSALCTLLSTNVLAGWQVANSSSSSSSGAHFIPYKDAAPTHHKKTYRSHLKSREGISAFSNDSASLGQSSPMYAVSISGSLKENIEHIMHRYHWKVVWKAPYDYNFDGRVTGTSLPNVVEKLLQPFPLQAVMYMSNRTLAVVPRTTHA